MEKTVQEQNKIEQLMRPRYKLVADYPGCSFEVGTILEPNEEGELYSKTAGYSWTITRVLEKDVRKFKHLFRKLEWWEERKPEEMPEYVKDEATGKILLIEYNMDGHTPCDVKTWNENEPPFWNTLYDLVPALESEYIQYTSKQPA